jgi:hypothetical protein
VAFQFIEKEIQACRRREISDGQQIEENKDHEEEHRFQSSNSPVEAESGGNPEIICYFFL